MEENNESVEVQTTDTDTAEQSDQSQSQSGESYKKHLAAEINKLRKANEALQKQISDANAAAQKEAEQLRQKKLAEEGDYKTALAEKDQAIELLQRSFEKKEKEWKIRAGLAGMNDLALAGAIANCGDDVEDVDKYIESIKTKYKDQFAQKRSAVDGARAATGSNNKSLRDRLAARDPEAMKLVWERTLAGENVDLS